MNIRFRGGTQHLQPPSVPRGLVWMGSFLPKPGLLNPRTRSHPIHSSSYWDLFLLHQTCRGHSGWVCSEGCERLEPRGWLHPARCNELIPDARGWVEAPHVTEELRWGRPYSTMNNHILLHNLRSMWLPARRGCARRKHQIPPPPPTLHEELPHIGQRAIASTATKEEMSVVDRGNESPVAPWARARNLQPGPRAGSWKKENEQQRPVVKIDDSWRLLLHTQTVVNEKCKHHHRRQLQFTKIWQQTSENHLFQICLREITVNHKAIQMFPNHSMVNMNIASKCHTKWPPCFAWDIGRQTGWQARRQCRKGSSAAIKQGGTSRAKVHETQKWSPQWCLEVRNHPHKQKEI